MGILDNRSALPCDLVARMELVGRFEVDCQSSGVDAGQVWITGIAPFRQAAVHDPQGFMRGLRELLLHLGGYAAYGAACCIAELLGYDQQNSDYLALLDAGIEFKRELGLSHTHLKGYEWSRWLRTHGADAW